jgi:phage terminase small subunit
LAGLTARQEAFVNYYCSNGFNATRAAISAGYSESTAKEIGYENLTKPHVKKKVDEFKAGRAKKAQITVDDLILELEEARDLAKEVQQPSALTGATMGKAKLLGLDQLVLIHKVDDSIADRLARGRNRASDKDGK